MFDMSAFMGKFIEEAKDRLQKLNSGILRLESRPDDKETLKEIMREAHTLKGSSKMMGLQGINQVSHIMEDLMVAITEGRIAVSPGICDILFNALDVMSSLVEKEETRDNREIDTGPVCRLLSEALEGKTPDSVPRPSVSGAASAEASAGAPPARPSPEPVHPSSAPEPSAPSPEKRPAEDTVRVGVEKIDQMANLTAELITDSIRALDFGKTIDEIFLRLEKHRKGHMAGGIEAEGILAALLPVFQDLSGRHAGFTMHLSHVVDQLRDQVMGIRMLPLSTVFDTYSRAVRDLAREMGKQIELMVEGGDTKLDKRIIEEIGDSLVHLIRNSIDHGIGTPEQRAALGKPAKGIIRISASQRGDRILIELEDDGRGIDPAIIRETAVKKNFISEADADRLSDSDIVNLIFLPGFSSRSAVSDISGRGIGMDVVLATAEKLGGRVSVSSVVGKGSRFTVELPLTVAILRVLVVNCMGNIFAVPVASIEQIIALGRNDVFTVEGRDMFYHQEHTIPLTVLSRVLGMNKGDHEPEETSTVLIIRGENEKRAGLVVDNVTNDEEIVIKELGNYLGRVKLVSAATIMPDGRIIMILDIPEIYRSIGRSDRTPGSRETRLTEDLKPVRRVILVAEDSTMVRELERDVLAAAGYEVVLAIDGLDAWEKLQGQNFDLLLTDIEMPGINGLELARQVRGDERLKDMAVIVVTSLDSPEHRRQGMEAGADAYVVKKDFDQQSLLDTVKRLVR